MVKYVESLLQILTLCFADASVRTRFLEERTLKTPLSQQSSHSPREEEGQRVAMEDRRRRSIAFEILAKEMLRYLDNSDDVKVAITELHERLETSENRYFCSASGPASDERKWPTNFEIFRQGEEELCIASWARWDAQLKGLVT